MDPFPPRFFVLFFMFMLLCFSKNVVCTANNNNGKEGGYLESECLSVPSSQFLNSLKSTIEIIQKVTSIVSQFSNVFGDFRLSNAINDCLDLLDFSVDELSWSISATQNPNSKHNSTGNMGSDLKTWLSGTLVNQDTCLEGFEGTNGMVKGIVAGSLNQITSLVHQLLTMVQPTPNSKSHGGSGPGRMGNKGGGGGGGGKRGRKLINTNSNRFPSWVRYEDRKLLQGPNGVVADVVVAQDGSGNFTKIMDALDVAPDESLQRFVIYIKKGVYKEYAEVKKKKWNVLMIGDGMNTTVISGNRSNVDGWTTYASATFAVKGRGFIARDMTFENTAGPEKHQAVAYRSDSDLSVLFRCSFHGYQDTLYAHSNRQFYRECKIHGTVDFIFGDGTVVFQNCQILPKRGLPQQKNTITAHGRKLPEEPTGFSFQFCNVSADLDLLPYANSTPTYLGRPWKPYSRTIFMQSYFTNIIRPEGWLEWNGNVSLDTLYYGEFLNFGPGAGLGGRVKWPGYHVLNNSAQANNYTVAQFLLGNSWLPSTGVTYVAGLSA